MPLFFGSQKAKIKAAQISFDAQNLLVENEKSLINNRVNELMKEKLKYKELLTNYKQSGKPLHDEIIRTSLRSYKAGEINFYQFVSSYEAAVQIQLEYFENTFNYNRYTTELNYFSR